MKMTVLIELQTEDFLVPETIADYKWSGCKDLQLGDTLVRMRLAEDMEDQLRDADAQKGRNKDLTAALERKQIELQDKGFIVSNLTHRMTQLQERITLLETALQAHVTKEGVETMLLARIDEGKLNPENKINCIKYVREITPWDLKMSKDFVEEVLGRCFPKPQPPAGDDSRIEVVPAE